MKIMIVASKYLPAVGGLETAVKNISLEMVRSGHEVKIVTNRYSRKLPRQEIIDGIPVERLFFTDRFPRTNRPWIWFKYLIRLIASPVSLYQLYRSMRKFQPEIVHLHFVGSPALYLWLISFSIPFKYIVSIHGSDVDLYPYKSSYQNWLLKRTFLAADFITSNSDYLLSKSVRMTETSIHNNSKVVPMAFSCDPYDGVFAPYKHSSPYVFAAGRFVYKKGYDVLISAFSSMIKRGEYKGDLILGGDGPEMGNLKKMVSALHLEDRIHFTGFLTEDRMAALMKGCDLFVAPSRFEAFGIIILEALYTGRRVVASDAGGIPELMEENREHLVPSGHIEALSAKMGEALSGKCGWNPVNAHQLKNKFNWKKVAADYAAIYQKLIQETQEIKQ